MDIEKNRAGTLIGAALIVSVISQIYYMTRLGGPQASDPAAGVTHADVVHYFTVRWPEVASVWTVEVAAFSILAVAALVALVRGAPSPAAWAALSLAGLLSLIQLGFGLTMFPAAATAGEEFAPVLDVIVGGAFFFYFLAKALIGLAGIGLGLVLWRAGSGAAKAVGALSVLVGLAAAAANIATLPQGMALILPAGATGTLAALFTGLAAWMVAGRKENAG